MQRPGCSTRRRRFSCQDASTQYIVGNTNRVSSVADSRPPITTHSEGPLRLRAQIVRERHGQKAKHCEHRRHQHRTQTLSGAFAHGRVDGEIACPKSFDATHHHDAVQHRLPEQRDEADRRRDRQRDAGDEEQGNTADQRERHIRQDQRRVERRPERVGQDDEDHEYRERHHDREPRHGALLVLELAGPGDAVAVRQLHGLRHPALHVGARCYRGRGRR